MDFEVRRATAVDVKAIAELRMELLESVKDVNEKNRSEVLAANINYFEDKLANGEFIAWIAIVTENVVSISGLVFFNRPPHGENLSGKEAYIMNMYTKPDYRGNGFARVLLEKCIEDCKDKGIGRIWLHTSTEGYPLYKKMGFIEKDTELELILNK